MIANKMGAPSTMDYHPISVSEKFTDHTVSLPLGDHFHLKTLNNSLGNEEEDDESRLLLVFLHGGGLSSMSWANCILTMDEVDPNAYEYCSLDFRGHGLTKTLDDSNLHINTLVRDVVSVLNQFYCGKEKKRDLVLIGHSLGGAVAIRCASELANSFNVRGMIVVDVVEGTSMSNLGFIKQLLTNRPERFISEQHAIRWCLQTGMIKNQKSARISVPSQLIKDEVSQQYVWRTELLKSEPFWTEWFQGLSEAFLSFHGPKMLLVANTDRLDNTLLIASMQGKFQFKVLKGAHIGHFLHEDDPKQTAQVILSFVNRFKVVKF